MYGRARSERRVLRAVQVVSLAFALQGAERLALADTSAADSAAAQALYDDGRRLIAQGKIAEACAKFKESQRLDPGVGTHFALADCYEKAGRTASAWVTFLDVASESKAQGRPDRAQVAQQRADMLAPKLTKVAIAVSDGARAPGLEIRRDGEVVGDGQWGTAVPVDPGPHDIRATAPDRAPWQTTLNATDAKTYEVTVPPLAPATAPPAEGTPATTTAPPAVVTPPPSAPVAPAPEAAPHQGLGTQRTIALVVGGVGVVGLAVGGIFGLSAISKHNDSTSHCDGSACDATGLQLVDDGKSAATIANIAIGAGAAALVGGVVLWFTAPRAHAARTGTIHATPIVGQGTAGMAVGGAF